MFGYEFISLLHSRCFNIQSKRDSAAKRPWLSKFHLPRDRYIKLKIFSYVETECCARDTEKYFVKLVCVNVLKQIAGMICSDSYRHIKAKCSEGGEFY